MQTLITSAVAKYLNTKHVWCISEYYCSGFVSLSCSTYFCVQICHQRRHRVLTITTRTVTNTHVGQSFNSWIRSKRTFKKTRMGIFLQFILDLKRPSYCHPMKLLRRHLSNIVMSSPADQVTCMYLRKSLLDEVSHCLYSVFTIQSKRQFISGKMSLRGALQV